jgi:N-acetylglucosamine malate deacetylase 1
LKLDALFLAAHPDDVELSCGGTVIKLSLSGKRTGIVDLTQGELSTRGNLKTRRIETNNASKILKVAKRINLAIPDGNIENNPSNRTKIIKIIREFRPEIIFLPHFYDRHPDHFHAHELIKEAAFYAGLNKIKTSLNGKQQAAYRAKKNFYFMQTYEFEPSFIVDISSTFKTKMQAVSCYKSQFYNPSSKEPGTFISDPRFIKFLESRAQTYGFKAGVEYGEPYFTEEKINLSALDLFNI